MADQEGGEQGNGCFGWLSQGRKCPTYVIAGVYELYEQLLPTRVYYSKTTRTGPCCKAAESVGHILAGCSARAQSKCFQRHNALRKILFLEISLDLIDSVSPRYSPTEPVYENDRVQALWGGLHEI